MSDVEDKLRQNFCEWLTTNGAKFPKIEWPSLKTMSGIRGAIATADIKTNEVMIEIPIHLMMSPPTILSDPDVGSKLTAMKDLLYGDLLISVFIMHELRKGDKSFYNPFLKILPEPGNISEWTDEELLMFQDFTIMTRVKGRRQSIKNMYTRSISMLSRLYPDTFPANEFTYEAFKFSWNSVQARAFGRRLPWTAMVPFADCLNHSNVQTKYDYDVDGNGMFRLFASGTNHYPCGTEVFNSYGRRPNENLLMDYGFALLHNEWDEVDLCLSLQDDHGDSAINSLTSSSNYSLRYRALFLIGSYTSRAIRIVDNEVSFQALTFLRIATMDPSILQPLILLVEKDNNNNNNSSDVTTGEEERRQCNDNNNSSSSSTSSSPTSTDEVQETVAATFDSNNGDTAGITGSDLFEQIVSAEVELKSLNALRGMLLRLLINSSNSWHNSILSDTRHHHQSSSIAEDEEALSILQSKLHQNNNSRAISSSTAGSPTLVLPISLTTSEANRYQSIEVNSALYWKTVSALHYRITRKTIIAHAIAQLDRLVSYFEAISIRLSAVASSADKVAPEYEDIVTIAAELWNYHVGDSILSLPDSKCEIDDGDNNGGRPLTQGYKKRATDYYNNAINPNSWSRQLINF